MQIINKVFMQLIQISLHLFPPLSISFWNSCAHWATSSHLKTISRDASQKRQQNHWTPEGPESIFAFQLVWQHIINCKKLFTRNFQGCKIYLCIIKLHLWKKLSAIIFVYLCIIAGISQKVQHHFCLSDGLATYYTSLECTFKSFPRVYNSLVYYQVVLVYPSLFAYECIMQ